MQPSQGKQLGVMLYGWLWARGLVPGVRSQRQIKQALTSARFNRKHRQEQQEAVVQCRSLALLHCKLLVTHAWALSSVSWLSVLRPATHGKPHMVTMSGRVSGLCHLSACHVFATTLLTMQGIGNLTL